MSSENIKEKIFKLLDEKISLANSITIIAREQRKYLTKAEKISEILEQLEEKYIHALEIENPDSEDDDFLPLGTVGDGLNEFFEMPDPTGEIEDFKMISAGEKQKIIEKTWKYFIKGE